jgi:hypothetical protein
MDEIWLRGNRRAVVLGFMPVLLLTAILLAALLGIGVGREIVGGLLVVALAALTAGIVYFWRRPVIAYRDGEVMFNLRRGQPIGVPVMAVEAFFLGQGPAFLPPVDGKEPETVNLIARLSQRYPELEYAEVHRSLGQWCHHYVVIRGTWCEPLNNDIIRRLNRRLRELHEGLAGATTATTSSTK